MSPRLAITLGDPRGIGPEVVTRALAGASFDAELVLIGAAAQVGTLSDYPSLAVDTEAGLAGDVDPASVGRVQAGRVVVASVRRAVQMALEGDVDAIVTGPAEKAALHAAGCEYPGHTEWLAALAGGVDVAMMLVAGDLRVVLLTTHVALRQVPDLITTESVVRAGEVTRVGLRDLFGISDPRLALCALNPHAGEGGLFGDEEQRVLEPAARALGATGPLPADTVFVRAARKEFDAVLTPAHDVGMTAVKVAGFGRGVNVTLGLPFVRTAPDHGTAFDIVGTGKADGNSMRAAIELARELTMRRGG